MQQPDVRCWADEILSDGNLRGLNLSTKHPASAKLATRRGMTVLDTRRIIRNYNALSRSLKDFLRWLDKGAIMQEVGKRLLTLSFCLAEIGRTSKELIADSAGLCERSRTLCKRSKQQRTERRKQKTAAKLHHHSPRLRVPWAFSPID